MIGLAILIPVALGLGLAGLAAFFWAIGAGQFDDLDGAGLRILNDAQPGEAGAGKASATVPAGKSAP
ncbi:hypothetical protein IP88_00335 [alpha proteobacterium AAP81b]|nr:hypothetical protein IP88_00335 [alpha proteobacterium AAP81b]